MGKSKEGLPIFLEKHLNKPERVTKALYSSFGGPDGYGYTWLDSDTTGEPVYNWIEIDTIGTRIEDSQWYTIGPYPVDDATAGPFYIGFDFPFHRLIFDSIYIGTNGLVSFSDSDLTYDGYFSYYYDDSWIPQMRFSNVLSVFYRDLNLNPGTNGGGDIYYWTNPDSDTFIVEYKNVKPYSDSVTTDTVTFQIILTTTDSSITYQYQSVVTTDSWVSGNLVHLDSTALIGIQDRTKYVGLRYYGKGIEGYENMPHSGLAVKFKKTVDVMHNMLACKSPISEWPYSDLHFYAPPDYVYYAEEAGADFPDNCVKVLNSGVYEEFNVPILCEISRKDSLGNETLVYSWTNIVNNLLSGDSAEVYFSNSWVPLERGKYWITYRAELPSDQVFSDDTTTGILFVERTILNSPWADTVPMCDGVIGPGEWNDANKYDISKFVMHPWVLDLPPCYDSNAVFVYIKNDSNCVYFAFDVPADTNDTDGDGGYVSIDENNNGFFELDSTEGRISFWNYASGDSLLFRTLTSDTAWPYWASQPKFPYEPVTGWDFGIGMGNGHRQVEIAIPFGTSNKWELDCHPGDTVGAYLSYVDMLDISAYWYNIVAYWPFMDCLDYTPTLLGKIYLCSEPAVPEIASLVFPPSGQKGLSEQMFLWTPATGAISYQLQIDEDSTFSNPFLIDTIVTTNGCFVSGLPDTSLWWRVRGENTYGYGEWSDQWKYTEVESEQKEDIPPLVFSLSQNYPNPFNPNTIISYTLAEDCLVKIIIYNILGQRVKTLVNETQRAGHRIVRWDGKDNKGQEVASGVYFYRIEAKDFIQSKKMVIIK